MRTVPVCLDKHGYILQQMSCLHKQIGVLLHCPIHDRGGKVPGGISALLEEHLILPEVKCQIQQIVFLPGSQRHFARLLSYSKISHVLRQSHYIKTQRIIKCEDETDLA